MQYFELPCITPRGAAIAEDMICCHQSWVVQSPDEVQAEQPTKITEPQKGNKVNGKNFTSTYIKGNVQGSKKQTTYIKGNIQGSKKNELIRAIFWEGIF